MSSTANKKSKKNSIADVSAPNYGFRYQSELVGLAFLFLSLIGVRYHEPWRDELQAFLLGRESHSLSELLNNIRYEGHPPLWHLILFIQSHVIDSITITQFIHILIATLTVYVFNKYFTLDYKLKILASFSYFLFYEFNLIARCYGLGILIFFSCMALYTNVVYRKQDQHVKMHHFITLGLLLILLSLTSVIGLIMTISMLCLIVTDTYILYQTKTLSPARIRGLLIVTLCSMISISSSIYFIKSEPDNSYPVSYTKSLTMDGVRFAVSKVFTNYFPILPNKDHNYWNNHVFVNDEQTIGFYLGSILLLLMLFFFLSHSRVTLFFLSGTIALMAFCYFTNMRPYRYSGHLFIFLISSFSLVEFFKKEKTIINFQIPAFVNALAQIVFTASLVCNLYASCIAYYKDIKYPFSNFPEAGEYVINSKLYNYAIMGSSDFIVSPLTYFTHKPIHLPESKRDQRFMIWDGSRRNAIDFNDIISELNLEVTKHDTVVLILSTPLTYIGPDKKTYAFQEDDINGTQIHMKFINNINSINIVNDENYYFYFANKKNNIK
jgi:hypothetical protein